MDTKRKADQASDDSLAKRLRPDTQGPLSVCVDEGSLHQLIQPVLSSGSRKSPTEERNLFVELEKMRTPLGGPETVMASPKRMEVASTHSIIPNITHHETSAYVDSTIQPSPKDSGVDMSSPERKIEDLGGLSSQESSPRIVDLTLPVQMAKGTTPSKPKYAAIGNIPQGHGLYVGEKEKDFGLLDTNMNNTEQSVCESKQCMSVPSACPRQSSSDHTDSELKDNKSPVLLPDLNSPSQSCPVNSCADLPIASQVCDTSDVELVAGSTMEDPEEMCNTDCTLAELNMSQKSTEAELRSLGRNQATLSSDSEDSGEGDSDFELFEKEECVDNDLFASLNDNSVCFTENGSPSKKMYLTPQNTPRSQKSQGYGKSLMSPTSKKNVPPVTGFMSEFAKFLQKSNVDDDDCKSESSTRSRACSSVSVEVNEMRLPTSHVQTPSSPQQTVSTGHKSSVCLVTAASHSIKKPIPIRPCSIAVPARSINETKLKVVAKPKGRRPSEFRTCSLKSVSSKPKTVKTTNFKPERFLNQQNKVVTLRRKVVRLLRTLFPNLDYPSSSRRTLNTADILLDQVLNCVRDRQRPSKKVEVIPTTPSGAVLDVRIVVCKTPLGCLRQLRRKVCHFLETVLPGLDLGWPFDRTGGDVEDLLSAVIQCNSPAS